LSENIHTNWLIDYLWLSWFFPTSIICWVLLVPIMLGDSWWHFILFKPSCFLYMCKFLIQFCRFKKSLMKLVFGVSGKVYYHHWSWYVESESLSCLGVLLSDCSLNQVSNPSIQFMLYEAMLSKLRKRRNSNSVTALEVLCHFANLHIKSLFSDVLSIYFHILPCYYIVIEISLWC